MPRKGQIQPLEERLWKYVIPEPMSGCWICMSYQREDGYCNFRMTVDGIYKTKLAHVVSYEFYIGPVPEGFYLDHKCRVRCCVNPRHLEPVTFAENILRGFSPAAIYARRTHCKNGHLLDNSISDRTCQVCHKAKIREWKRIH